MMPAEPLMRPAEPGFVGSQPNPVETVESRRREIPLARDAKDPKPKPKPKVSDSDSAAGVTGTSTWWEEWKVAWGFFCWAGIVLAIALPFTVGVESLTSVGGRVASYSAAVGIALLVAGAAVSPVARRNNTFNRVLVWILALAVVTFVARGVVHGDWLIPGLSKSDPVGEPAAQETVRLFEVGMDLEPGWHRTAERIEETEEAYCSVVLTADADGEDWIHAFYASHGYGYIYLPEDTWLQARHCHDWEPFDTTTPVETPTASTLEPGMSIVGWDVPAGHYQPVASNTDRCEIGTYGGLAGDTDDANELSTYVPVNQGRPILELRHGELVELSSDCPDWHLVDPVEALQTVALIPAIEDGAWQVGTQIEAGEYQLAEDLEMCRWVQWRGYRVDGREARVDWYYSNPAGPVTLRDGDILETVGCGTWEQVG